KQVINYFAEEYKAGRTPNPCVMCNEKLKFGTLINRARQLGAEFIATGHFARVEKSADGTRMLLKRGRDARKDQSYFLFSLRQEQLARTLFPLGELTKTDTRCVARENRLKTADKEESMEICFVPDKDYGRFLQQANLVQKHRGEIVNLHGQVLGHHEGIEFYTIGQRKGLGISSPKPLYVVELDAANNRVVVGDESALERDDFFVERCNWIPFETPPATMEVSAKIRYNHPGTTATITPEANGRARVKLHVPQRAITPGQACVFYQDDLVVGGGWIGR
ncbi:MAG TPA: tRNA 2-thiouridine(34) synthase MnmA, partial [Verrucomicrobiae bacterium]|nr:tRNA 2-thiouridine(34) synthase MnmA [Verrucomicrobiae bacterium]